MQRANLKPSSNPKIFVGIVAFVLLLLSSVQVAQGLIDTKRYVQYLMDAVKEATGQDIVIKGNVSLSLLPLPTLYVPAVEMHGDQEFTPNLTVDMLSVKVSVFSLFSDHPVITGITLKRPTLDMERTVDNVVHWDWLEKGIDESLAASFNGTSSFKLDISEGKIIYHNARTDQTTAMENISLSGTAGQKPKFKGQFNLFEHDISVNIRADEAAEGGGKKLTVGLLSGANDSVDFDGSVNLSGDTPVINGKIGLNIEDAITWLESPTSQKANLLSSITNQATKQTNEKVLLPIKFSGDWAQEGTSIHITNAILQGLNSAGVGSIKATWEDSPVFTIAMDFSAWDYNRWRLLIDGIFKEQIAPSLQRSYRDDDGTTKYLIPADISVNLHVAAAKVYINGQTWENAELQTELSDGDITVNQLNIDLPGQTTMAMFGVVSQSKTQSLRFEGSMESQGKSLRQFLTVFDESAKELPDTGFGEFYIRSNVYIAPDQFRLSEADVKINELKLNGGLVAYYDENPRLEADVRLKDINFDYFRNVWRDKKKNATPGHEDVLKYNQVSSYEWLKRLHTRIDFRVNVDRFTFLERQGDTASFRLFAKEGEFGIYNVHMYYPNDNMEASLSLDVNGSKPLISLLLNTNEFNTDYFKVDPDKGPDPLAKPDEDSKDTDKPAEPVASDKDAKPDDGSGKEKQVRVVPQAADGVEIKEVKDTSKDAPKEAKGETAEKATEKAEAVAKDKAAPSNPDEPPPLPAVSDAKPAEPEKLDADKLVADKPSDKPAEQEGPKPLAKNTPVISKKWSEELIDMSWMEGINGAFDVSIGKLVHRGIDFDRLRIHAKLEDNLMTFQSLSFYYWQGKCDIAGSIYGGKVPGISIGYTIYNADMQDMMHTFTSRDNITGRISISGTLATSGVNYLSWIAQSEAKVVVAGRGVNVDGFNLQGAVNAVNVSRTAADVLNNVNLALSKGTTEFTVDGNLNIKNGVARTPGITLRASSIVGNMTGELKLVPWTTELATFFQFPTMTSETIPTMTVSLVGNADDPEMQVDTSSLEAYVAKRIVGK